MQHHHACARASRIAFEIDQNIDPGIMDGMGRLVIAQA